MAKQIDFDKDRTRVTNAVEALNSLKNMDLQIVDMKLSGMASDLLLVTIRSDKYLAMHPSHTIDFGFTAEWFDARRLDVLISLNKANIPSTLSGEDKITAALAYWIHHRVTSGGKF